jgi:hypothetical protein
MPEITGRQTLWPYTQTVNGVTVLPAHGYAAYRMARRNPTVKLVRSIIIGAVASAGWSYKCADGVPDERTRFIRSQMERHRAAFVQRAMAGGVDFGWSPFEAVFDFDPGAGMIGLTKVKPLLQDITDILVDDLTGDFLGFRQVKNGAYVAVPYTGGAVIIPWRMEGTNWHGEALMRDVLDIVRQWNVANAGAAKYDAKIVGSRWVVYYPDKPGGMKSPWGVDRVEKYNYEIAQAILDVLETSGGVGVPTTAAQYVNELNSETMGWKIEALSDKGGAPLLMERLRYLDVLLCRGMEMPERTMIEGAAEGQKAGTETAQGFAIGNLAMAGAYICAVANMMLLDPLLAWNYGSSAKGSVYVEMNPIGDEARELLTEIVRDVLKAQPEKMDLDAAMDAARIPKSKEVIDNERIDNVTE